MLREYDITGGCFSFKGSQNSLQNNGCTDPYVENLMFSRVAPNHLVSF